MNNNLYAQLRAATKDPEKVFLITPDGRSISYEALFFQSERYAAVLVNKGVKPGDRVAVQTDKAVEALYLYLGCLAAGAVYLPLNPAYTPSEIAYFLGDAEPVIFICDPARQVELESVARNAGVHHVETLSLDGKGTMADTAEMQQKGITCVSRKGDDLAAILYTSGTTGRSKGAMLTHDNLASNARALVDAWRITADDVLLHALPIFHTHGLFVAISTTLLANSSMLYLPRFDVNEVVRLLPQATTMMGVPTFYSRLLSRDDFGEVQCGHMRLFISGSAPLSAEVHKAFSARTGHAILERYGMTETNMNTSNPYDGNRRPGTVGLPLPGVELRITDTESEKPLKAGAIGMIEVRGPNVFTGYWRQPEKSAEELRENGFFITGDMGIINEDGYVSIVGRSKDLIISGGFNVYPAEVEAVLDEIPGVAESAVIGLAHPDFGECVTAIIAAHPGCELDGETVRCAAADKLAKFKVPKKIIISPVPRNTMGKIQKNALREQFKKLYLDDV